jgi:sensor histidine kinase YesM
MILNFSANKARVKTIGWHLLFWLIYILYEEALVLYAKQPAEPFGTLYSFLINAVVFYNFWRCIRYLTKKIKNIFVLILAILIAATVIIAVTVFFKILGDAIILNVSFKAHATPFRRMSLIVRTIYFGGMGACYGFAKELIQKEREAAHMVEQQQILEKKALKAELNVIKSQINPHFIFNTLGFLYAETYKKLPEVSQTIIALSNIMRYAITNNKDGYSSLQSELDCITDFIKIHENRSKAFFMKTTIEGEAAPYKVASLVLMTLIENMFKHGTFNQNAKEAILNITIENRKLHFYSLNYKNNIVINKAQSNGIGLNFIRERLTDEYGPEGYELLINETDNTYECKLIMPLKYPENNTDVILKADRNPVINQKPIYV